ncbi:MAG: PilT/PilU family type 4a pilus ATPase [Geobacter sp.]|nr:PilT/PilU family type 4a pilus ATPase [Geobacter sp.]
MRDETAQNPDHRIGQLLIESGIVTREQLDSALKRQSHSNERIGSVLLQLGYIDTETLLEFLRRHFGTPSIDLFRIHITPQILGTLTMEQMLSFQALPIIPSTKGLFVAMADPDDFKAINELEFILGKKVEPVAVPHAQLEAALRYIRKKAGGVAVAYSGEEAEKEQATALIDEATELHELISVLLERNASDLLISAGVPPCLKLDGEIVRLSGDDLTPDKVEQWARELMTAPQWQEFMEKGELDFGFSSPNTGRFRVDIYRQRGSISLAIRNIVEEIPTLASCGLPEWLEEFTNSPQGLILISGPTGHGKSTTLAALVNLINTKRRCNIITIEDPIEFLHKHKMSNINQREVGRDTPSFHEGLSHIFRQAPDVIVIGEMRDPESFEIAVQAAETGHLVLSTMHANSSTSAIERIIEIFPPEKQQQMRMQLADVFLLILNQRLIPKRGGRGRALAYEKLANTTRIKNMIRESKTFQIRSIFQYSAEEYHSLEFSLNNLVRRGEIDIEEAAKVSENPAALREMVLKR